MKIPPAILEKLENATAGLDYGSAVLRVEVKKGQARFIVQREESFLPTDDGSAGSGCFSKEGTEKSDRRV